MGNDTLLTVKDVAERLQVSTKTVRRWIKNHELEFFVFGAQYRISENDLEYFMCTNRASLQADDEAQS